jgi:hypothetical protein
MASFVSNVSTPVESGLRGPALERRHTPAIGVALGLAAGYLAPVRNVVEPLVEMLRPIPPLAMLRGPA